MTPTAQYNTIILGNTSTLYNEDRTTDGVSSEAQPNLQLTLDIINWGGGKARAWLKDKVETNRFALPVLHRPASLIPEDIWRACPATTNSNEQAHRNVNRDGVNLTLLGGIMRGRAFDNRAAQSIDIHTSLGIGPRDRDSTHTYRKSRSITRQAPPCHSEFGGTGNRHQHHDSQHHSMHRDALQQPVPPTTVPFTPVLSYTLVNALRPDIRGVLEPCLWPRHTMHDFITAALVTGTGFDDSLVPLHLEHVPISQFNTLNGALYDDSLGATQTSVHSTYNKTL